MSDLENALSTLAQRIAALGLTVPAIAMLEMHKPLVGIFHAAALVGQPTFSFLFGTHSSRILLEIFESKDNIDRFIEMLELTQDSREEKA